MSIYEQVQRLNIPIKHRGFDLHIPITPETQRLIDKYIFKNNVTIFTSPDGKKWFDIPFAYEPAWVDENLN